ncbi:hypothetical protein JCM3774_001132 [Rhodotorula dairenensis]
MARPHPPPPRHPASPSFTAAAAASPSSGRRPAELPTVLQRESDEDSDARLAAAIAQLDSEVPEQDSPLRPPGAAPPPLPPPPIRSRLSVGESTRVDPAIDRKLEQLQDLEIAQLLARVGHRLTDVRVAQACDAADSDVATAVGYPTRETFTDPETGKVDWIGYLGAYAACLATNLVPASLVDSDDDNDEDDARSAGAREFSLGDLRDQLERTYVLCPPPVWQRLVLTELASLWRWDRPTRTGTCLGTYLVAWWYDLFLLLPVVALTAVVVKARLFPPSPQQLVRLARDRHARSRDARVLGKQLKASSVVGYAGQGVKGLWADLRARLRDVDDKNNQDDVYAPRAEQQDTGSAAASTSTARAAAPVEPDGDQDPDTRTGAATSATDSTNLDPEKLDAEQDPARPPGSKPGDADVSLYRLVRNLTATFGPNAILWLAELNDLGERIKNIVVHPEHPSVRHIALRLVAICVLLAVTPISLVYKTAWLYLGLDFFILWKVRSAYPQWRGVTLPHRWLLLGAPNDVQYTLYVLRQRQLAGKPIRSAKTLRRRARRATTDSSDLEVSDDYETNDNSSSRSTSGSGSGGGGGGGGKLEKTKARARALSSAVSSVLDEADKYRSRRSTDFAPPSSSLLLSSAAAADGKSDAASVMSLPRGKPEASYFALYSSKPGSLCFYLDRLTFVPARQLASLGRLSSRFSSSDSPRPSKDAAAEGDPHLFLAEDADDVSVAESAISAGGASTASSRRTLKSTLASVLAEGGEVVVSYDQIQGVSKNTKMRAFEGLAVTTKDGRSFKFRNVSRRDEAFTKLLSFTALKWKQQ